MTARPRLHRWEDLPLETVTDMVARKAVCGAETTITQAYFKKGALVPIHAHAGEQVLYVLQGALRAQVAGDDQTVREGDVLVIEAGAAHQAEALDDTFLIAFLAESPV